MIILLKFWRECIIALLVFLLLICLFIQNYQAKQIKSANAACKAEIAKIELAQHQAQVAEQNKVNEVSATYEEDRAERQIETQIIYKTIEKIVDRPVYRNTCIDEYGLHEINSLIKADNSS